MGKCVLSIEIDDDRETFRGGDRVRGAVVVRTDADVRCKGLEVTTGWATHGRGNIASGDVEKAVLFEGDWLAGQEYRYPFDLRLGEWPPTYHGHFLNVDHHVQARAKIPWAFDPKRSTPVRVVPRRRPPEQANSRQAQEAGCVGKVVGVGILVAVAVFFVFMAMNPVVWVLGLLAGAAAGGWWFFKRYLPARILGGVQCEIGSKTLTPGDALRGELIIQPKRNVTINGIRLKTLAVESCTSGSGSSRSTHTHTAFQMETEVADSCVLRAGESHRFHWNVALPDKPLYSMELTANQLTWSTELRVDIPSWPDWTKSHKFVVVPRDEDETASERSPRSPAQAGSDQEAAVVDEPASESAITFAKTAQFIWASRDDAEKIDRILQAVAAMTFDVAAVLDASAKTHFEHDPYAVPQDEPRETAVFAHFAEPPLPLVLLFPPQLAETPHTAASRTWRGRGQIIDYDHRRRRLRIRVVA